MFWKIYFWFLVILLVPMYILEGVGIWDLIDGPLTAVALIGLFSYAYEKIFLNGAFWKIFTPIYIVWDLVYNFIISEPAGSNEISVEAIFGLYCFIFSPLYVCLFFYCGRLYQHERRQFYKDKKNLSQDLQNIDLTSGTADHSAPARIFVIRKSIKTRSGMRQYVKLDGETISELLNGQFTRVEASEGNHTIGISERSDAFFGPEVIDREGFELTFEGGRTYYYSIKNESLFPTLEQISAENADQLFDKLKSVPAKKTITKTSAQG